MVRKKLDLKYTFFVVKTNSGLKVKPSFLVSIPDSIYQAPTRIQAEDYIKCMKYGSLPNNT